jgi:PAS domain S-box-containing protein
MCKENPGEKFKVHLSKLLKGKVQRNLWEFSAISDDEGNIVEIQCIGYNATPELELADKLEHVVYKHKMAEEAGELGIWEYDYEDDYLIWDDKMFDIYGKDKSDFRNSFIDWEETVITGEAEEAKGLLQNSIDKGEKFKATFRINAKGKIKYIEAFGQPYTEEGKRKIIGTNRDITEREMSNAKSRRLLELEQKVSMLGNIGGWEYKIENERLIWTDQIFSIFEKIKMNLLMSRIYLISLSNRKTVLESKIYCASY